MSHQQVPLSKAHKTFVQTFLQVARVQFPRGYSEDDDEDLLTIASDAFEELGGLEGKIVEAARDGGRYRLSPKRA